MKSGFFNKDRIGGYTITNPDLKYAYEYNLVSDKMLVQLDQNGPIKIQANPPEDIVLIQRNYCEKYSKWLTYFEIDGKKYCNFARPYGEKPKDTKITYLPEKAVYTYNYGKFIIETTVFIPLDSCDVVMRVDVINNCKRSVKGNAYVQLLPLIAFSNLAAWDRPDWYLRNSVHHDKDFQTTFFSRLMNPRGIASKRRNVSFNVSGRGEGAECILENYAGAGDFYAPSRIADKVWSYDYSKSAPFGEMKDFNSVAGFPGVYATKQSFSIKGGQSYTITQVLSMLDNNQGQIPDESISIEKKNYFDKKYFENKVSEVEKFYDDLFKLNNVTTKDATFDSFVNAFLPLQMRWVGVLDRGWPTGMRGTRDAANDFMGMLQFDAKFSREVLVHLFECEQLNGWFPRQVGSNRKGPHDLRNYVDGGVFALEFLYEYTTYTKDYTVLDEVVSYSDSDETSTLLVHVQKALDYYVDNIGEDGLTKIWEGDWFDGVNQAGLKGRGQGVTVSCQFIMALGYVKQLLKAADKSIDFSKYDAVAEKMQQALNDLAFNKAGFFSSLKNDNGEWIFSDNDPDGEARMFAVPNAFAIFTGVATDSQAKSVLENFGKRLKTDIGYKLFCPSFQKPLDAVGRISCGDVASGLLGNSTVYNHGSQGFLARACCYAQNAQMADDVISWILPYDQIRHPEELTGAAPYAILNTYQDVAPYKQKAGFSFLTGTVAMLIRVIYHYMFGISPTYEGIMLTPCLTCKYDGAKVTYNYNGKKLNFEYKQQGQLKVFVNGVEVTDVADRNGKKFPLVKEESLVNDTKIEVWF